MFVQVILLKDQVLWVYREKKALPKSPFQFFFWSSSTGDVNGQKKLFEIDETVLVCVEGSENVVAELFRVSAGEKHLVHVYKLDRRQPAVGAILLEPLVPLLDRVLVVARMRTQKVQVFLGQTLFALDATHFLCLLSTGEGEHKKRNRNREIWCPQSKKTGLSAAVTSTEINFSHSGLTRGQQRISLACLFLKKMQWVQ